MSTLDITHSKVYTDVNNFAHHALTSVDTLYCLLFVFLIQQLSHSILESLRGTKNTWLVKLLHAFNAGI